MNLLLLLYLNIKANFVKIEQQIKDIYSINITSKKEEPKKNIKYYKKKVPTPYIQPKEENSGPSSICSLDNAPEFCGPQGYQDTTLSEEPNN